MPKTIRLIFLLMVCPLISTNVMAALFERSHALVIGINHYPDKAWPPLSYAVKDAEGMAAFLKAQGFEVTMLLNEEATRANIIDVVNERLAPRLGNRDRVLVFFSGHGETREIGGRDFGYIIPYDGGKSASTWISMVEMREISSLLGEARHQLFIFDSCYGGQFAVPRKGPLSSVSENHPRYIEKVSANLARQYITAGGKGELVRANGPKGYSYFTGYLLEALEGAADLNGDSYITSSELDAYLQPRASNWDHTPIAGVLPEHGQGNFWFRVPRSSSVSDQQGASPLRVPDTLSTMKGIGSEQVEKRPSSMFLLRDMAGMGPVTAKKFMAKGLDTVEKIAALTDEEILYFGAVIPGLAETKLKSFREHARELLGLPVTSSR